ncbi:RNA-dependent DNA polymerase [Bacillus toyonensis]|uniref:reverse transcriptase domain-containing protein n=1 Tax=Bacillus toyonensis TaxID=155322 RepID=UPI000BFAA6EA|nr:reverse transcriptase domain-containing protein [Bacillus toyonensis]PGE10202.1 RNA-dependent DNA polymerase [Bacillus toyonensis]
MDVQTNYYQIKYIKTKKKTRKIVTYTENYPEIRVQHEKIADFINKQFIPSLFSKAYIKKTSIYHNVLPHMYNDIFILLDIKDFFNSINHKILIDLMYYELNKKKKNTINKLECAKIISRCSITKKGLPLGFITSPTLSNIYMKQFDNILYGKLKKLELTNVIYTRYADDLVISFKRDVLSSSNICVEKIINQVKSLLLRYKLQLNTSKTKVINFEETNHVKITGVNIIRDSSTNRKLSIGRKIKNDLFHKAIKCYENENTNKYDILRVKGLESFILSIEKKGYEETYSKNMRAKVKSLGFNSLHELINNLL